MDKVPVVDMATYIGKISPSLYGEGKVKLKQRDWFYNLSTDGGGYVYYHHKQALYEIVDRDLILCKNIDYNLIHLVIDNFSNSVPNIWHVMI